MTDADEAILWAREYAKQMRSAPNNPDREQAMLKEIDAGKHDDELSDISGAYRAGAAASAERIAELEARVRELEALVQNSTLVSAPGACVRISIPGRIYNIPDSMYAHAGGTYVDSGKPMFGGRGGGGQ